MFFGKKPSPPATTAPSATPADVATPTIATEGPTTAAAAEGGAKLALTPDEAKKRVALAKHIAASFGEIVTLLMRSPTDKTLPIQELEWLVVPALLSGQFAVAEAQSRDTGAVSPVAAVLWAFVSPDVDGKLSTLSEKPYRLQAADWKSGTIPWIIMALGDQRVVGGLLQQLAKTTFKDVPAKMRARAPDGKVVVGHLEIATPPPTS